MTPSVGTGYWAKLLKDGTTEFGSDQAIKDGKVSWTRGRQDIVSVLLSDGCYTVDIVARIFSDWYQFDRYIVPVAVGTQEPVRTHRGVQIQITEDCVDRYMCCDGFGHSYVFTLTTNKALSPPYCSSITNHFAVRITKKMVGSWITVILPLNQKPYFVVSDIKGSINGNFKQILK